MYFIADNVIFGSATVLNACTVLLVNHKRALGISSSFDQNGLSFVILGKTRLFRRNIAPFLDHRLLNLPWVGPRSCADLLRNIHTLLSRGKLGYKFGNMLAGPLWLEITFFLWSILNNSLSFVIAFLSSLFESTACRGAELPGLLGTSSDGSILLHGLLRDSTHLLGPLGTLGIGCVSRGLILTLLLHLSLTLNNIILNLMYLLLGPALGLILCSTDFRTLNITVLYKRSSANLDSLIKGNLLIFNETAFPKVFFALLLLLRLKVGDICSVTPLVIGVITLHHIIILSLFNHLYLVNTLLAIGSGSSSSNICKPNAFSIFSLPGCSAVKELADIRSVFLMMRMVMLLCVTVEGKGVHERSLVSADLPSQLSFALARAKEKNYGQNSLHTHCYL